MNGERFELSGVNPLAAMALVRTSLERMTSMSTKRNNDQATKPARAVSVEFMRHGTGRETPATARVRFQWGLTFDMSGGPKAAKRPLERPLDGGVRRHWVSDMRPRVPHRCAARTHSTGRLGRSHERLSNHLPWIESTRTRPREHHGA